MENERRVSEQLARVARVLGERKNKGKLLEEIAWSREIEEAFFASGATRLPTVEYRIDRDTVAAQVAELGRIEASIEGEDAVATWLRATVRSLIGGNELLLAIGTRDFYRCSRDLYGGARTAFFGASVRNIDLADHLLARLRVHGWDEDRDAGAALITAPELAERLTTRAEKRRPRLDLEIVLDERATAKCVAGMTRIRIRPDATFAPWEVEGLWHHEIETHALTAQNGALQPGASFLRSGGPRTTRTQEGLAVFSELYNRALSIGRLERLATRVKLVDMAEQGASFLDLYRFLIDRGAEPRDAYFDAQRVCRGGLVTGSAPFTKDACYLAGLLEVNAFLSAVIRGGFRDEIELLVSGRICLDDIAALVELRAAGILSRPKYLPRWLSSWETLLPFFAFSSFMDLVDLRPVEEHYRALIKVAEAARPRDAPADAGSPAFRDKRGAGG
ncbi:MAG: flavohemoglobin expression-modulating QEGLA motif protein [Byssovorax sp.]